MRLEGKGKYQYCKSGEGFKTVHRKVMHEIDPRPNEDELVVHHIDGDKGNNDPSNLMWMTNSEHSRFHHLGENHFPCAGQDNANYRHGMCVGGHSREYKKLLNRGNYERHREERIAKQQVYDAEHHEHILWYHQLRHWRKALAEARTEERVIECKTHIKNLEENPK